MNELIGSSCSSSSGPSYIPVCPYCGSPAELVKGIDMYPHRPQFFGSWFWRCKPCDASVGCHRADCGFGDGTRPYGALANKQLRDWRGRAHRAFDPLWASPVSKLDRARAYQWLAGKLGVREPDAHIGGLSEPMCRRVVTLCVTKLKELTAEYEAELCNY